VQTATSALVLGDLVAQEDLGLTLLSGGAGALDREVAGAHSIDVENPTRFLGRRWVMLSAGMRLKGSVAAQRALIRELDEHDISALGIGVELVFKRVPPALLEEARERSFPVVAVPLSTAFRDIVAFVNRSLLSSDLHTYQRLAAIQRHLVDALREANPRQAMVERLSRMLDAGVLLLDGEHVAAGSTPDPERVSRRVAEREYEEDGWHVVAVPIGPSGWLAVTARSRHATRLARPAAQAAVPLLVATDRLSELARDQEQALRAALLDEILDGGGPALPGGARGAFRGRAARARGDRHRHGRAQHATQRSARRPGPRAGTRRGERGAADRRSDPRAPLAAGR
jgi:purine catabolism regulator